jgi:predicted dehydrogenase
VYGATYTKFGSDKARVRVGYKCADGGVYDVEDTAVGFIRLENDATIDFDFSWASNIEKEVKFVELLGTKGGVSFENGAVKLFSQAGNVCVSMLPDTKTIPVVRNEHQEFVDCIINDIEPSASPEQACDLMKIIDSIYVSANQRREVIIDRTD